MLQISKRAALINIAIPIKLKAKYRGGGKVYKQS
jgi:hypothetical protein